MDITYWTFNGFEYAFVKSNKTLWRKIPRTIDSWEEIFEEGAQQLIGELCMATLRNRRSDISNMILIQKKIKGRKP